MISESESDSPEILGGFKRSFDGVLFVGCSWRSAGRGAGDGRGVGLLQLSLSLSQPLQHHVRRAVELLSVRQCVLEKKNFKNEVDVSLLLFLHSFL